MSFNFTVVEKMRFGNRVELPEGVVRLNKKSMTFGGSTVRLFNSTKYTTKAGEPKIRIGVGYDVVNQAIQLRPDENGFSGGITDTGNAHAMLPKKFREAGLPLGDYKLVEGETNIYQLAR